MKKKRKIIGLITTISASAFALTALTFGVLAATTQSVKNNFSINYAADDVSATLKASYKIGDTSPVDFVNSANTSSTELTFVATDGNEQTGSLQAPGENNQITLTAENDYVIIKNSFTNNNSATGRYLVVNFQNNMITESVNDNINVLYFPSSYGTGTNFETKAKIETSGNGAEYASLAFPAAEQKTLYIAPQETFYIYTLIKISDPTLDVSVPAANATAFALSTVASSSVPASWGTYVSANESKWGEGQQGGGQEQQGGGQEQQGGGQEQQGEEQQGGGQEQQQQSQALDESNYPNLVFTVKSGTQNVSVRAASAQELSQASTKLSKAGDSRRAYTMAVNSNISGNLEIPSQIIKSGQAYTVTEVENNAFSNSLGTAGSENIGSVEIPNTVTRIGNNAFAYCRGITSVTIPSSVMAIGSRAFYLCNHLQELAIPSSVTSIGGSAFYGCSAITTLTIPAGIISFGDEVFRDCTSLESVEILGGNAIGSMAFSGC